MTRKARQAEFELQDWYTSNDAKRNFGSICKAVYDLESETGLLGSEDEPLILLKAPGTVKRSAKHVVISIDQAKAEWSSITAAVLFFDTTFRIKRGKRERAVLTRHPINRHNALKYRRDSGGDIGDAIRRLEDLTGELRTLLKSLESSSDLIERRFRETWRIGNGLPATPAH